jgi:hypothetical protein
MVRLAAAALLLLTLAGCAAGPSVDSVDALETELAQIDGVTAASVRVGDTVRLELGFPMETYDSLTTLADAAIAVVQDSAWADQPIDIAFTTHDIEGATTTLQWEGLLPATRDHYAAASRLWFDVTRDPLIVATSLTFTADAVSGVFSVDPMLDPAGLQAAYVAQLVSAGYTADRVSLSVTTR